MRYEWKWRMTTQALLTKINKKFRHFGIEVLITKLNMLNKCMERLNTYIKKVWKLKASEVSTSVTLHKFLYSLRNHEFFFILYTKVIYIRNTRPSYKMDLDITVVRQNLQNSANDEPLKLSVSVISISSRAGSLMLISMSSQKYLYLFLSVGFIPKNINSLSKFTKLSQANSFYSELVIYSLKNPEEAAN